MPLGYTVGLIFVIHTPGARHYFVKIVKFTVFWLITQIALPAKIIVLGCPPGWVCLILTSNSKSTLKILCSDLANFTEQVS